MKMKGKSDKSLSDIVTQRVKRNPTKRETIKIQVFSLAKYVFITQNILTA